MRYKPLSSPFYIFENKKHKNFKLFAKVTHVVIGKDGIWIKVVLKPNAWAEQYTEQLGNGLHRVSSCHKRFLCV